MTSSQFPSHRAADLTPELLLAHAKSLLPSGRGNPRTADLRRAISASYYVAFHQLSKHAAQCLIQGDDWYSGRLGWSTAHAQVARWITHTDLVGLCEDVVALANNSSKPVHPGLAPRGLVDPRLAEVCQSLIDLHSARTDADYDVMVKPSKRETVMYTEVAGRLLVLTEQLLREGEASYLRFLALALGARKVAKRR
ncbi:hypothetical protein AXF14_01860 [Actinomyces radicidentis]|uniref:Uncharacterized protein n=1 Tax=Actinomyces radicidentis TaxID=111015 RepID=A0A0X8JCX2_ACTRD|nr:hypothetical protein AXF14_01860 [Actinomyces radicidentis]